MSIVGLLLLSASLPQGTLGARIALTVNATEDDAVKGKNQICTVKEKDSHVHYGLGFSFHTPGSSSGCSRVKCSTFTFFEKTLPQFLVPALDKTRSHTCGCWLKQMTATGPSKEDSFLFSFLVTGKSPCAMEVCWQKYSDASFLAKRVTDTGDSRSVLEHPASHNHWVASCDGGATASQPSINMPSIASMVHQLKKLGDQAKQNVEALKMIVNIDDELDERDEKAQEVLEQSETVITAVQKGTVEDGTQHSGDGKAGADTGAMIVGLLNQSGVSMKETRLVQVVLLGPGKGTCSKPREPFAASKDVGVACGLIDNADDCEEAQRMIGARSFTSLKRALDRQPAKCYLRTTTNAVMFNPHHRERMAQGVSGGRSVGENLLCGCYKEIVPPTPEQQAAAAEVKAEIAKAEESEEEKAADNARSCEELPSGPERAACICHGANNEASVKEMARQCTARDAVVQQSEPEWHCVISRSCANKHCTKKTKSCAAQTSWR